MEKKKLVRRIAICPGCTTAGTGAKTVVSKWLPVGSSTETTDLPIVCRTHGEMVVTTRLSAAQQTKR